MPKTHLLPAEHIHSVWDNSIPAGLTVAPGDTVVFQTPEITKGQITKDSTVDVLANFDFSPIHQISGPVAVEGAEPGDTLVVDIVSIKVADWGWTAIIPGFGLLADDEVGKTPFLHIWDLSNGVSAELKPGVVVPFEPFCGIMGVAPAEPGALSTVPPRKNGGNIDLRQLTQGSTLFMPVLHPGANFSVGDVHAAQGDGEVCGTAIECPAKVTVRFNLIKNHAMENLAFRMPGAMTGSWNTKGWMGTTAHGPDMFASAQQALRDMIFYLQRAHGLSAAEAYVLCSACMDLKISEIVDAPNWLVSALFPLGVFTS